MAWFINEASGMRVDLNKKIRFASYLVFGGIFLCTIHFLKIFASVSLFNMFLLPQLWAILSIVRLSSLTLLSDHDTHSHSSC